MLRLVLVGLAGRFVSVVGRLDLRLGALGPLPSICRIRDFFICKIILKN